MFKKSNELEYEHDETRGIILDILSKYVTDHPQEKRRVDLLNAFLEVNKTNSIDQKKKKIKNLLKGYTEMNASLKKILKDLGFEIIEGRKHYKIRYHGDTRYQFTVSKTGSDRRAGANLAAEICKAIY